MSYLPFSFLFLLYITQLVNITHVDGLASDFSNMILQVVTQNSSYNTNYTISQMQSGQWAVANVTVPESNYTLNILSAENASFNESYGSSFLDISYSPGLLPDFSNLAVEFVDQNGSTTTINYTIVAKSDGAWATIALGRPPSGSETIAILAAEPTNATDQANQANATNQTNTSPAPALNAGNFTLDSLWPLALGNSWTFQDGSGNDSFALSIVSCGDNCTAMNETYVPANSSSLLVLTEDNDTLFEKPLSDWRSTPPLPLVSSASHYSWQDQSENLTIDVSLSDKTILVNETNAYLSYHLISKEINGINETINYTIYLVPGIGPVRIDQPDGSVQTVEHYEVH